jgi:hypothetical protein
MSELHWLTEEVRPLTEADERAMDRELRQAGPGLKRGGQEAPALAVRLRDLVIHDNQKWFRGEADIRVDALVLHGGGRQGQPDTFYAPGTFHFPRVANGDCLPTGENGLLIFYGRPLYFLEIFILVSRDRKGSDDLATLLSSQFQSQPIQAAVGTLLGLAVAAPQVAAVTAALVAAAELGRFSYQVLRQVTGDTVGLHRASWLQHRDRFGVDPSGAGRHPKTGTYLEKDFSFWYEIVLDRSPSGQAGEQA